MNNEKIVKFYKNKYTHLLLFLTACFFLSPFLEEAVVWFPVFSLVFLCAVILTLRTLFISRRALTVLIVVAVFGFLLDIGISRGVAPQYRSCIRIVTSFIYAVILCGSGISFAKRLFNAGKVTRDTIMGGICLYFIIGFIWTLLFALVHFFDRQAFGTAVPGNRIDFFYFSFATLTTLGYVDIWPAAKFPRALANFEAIVGQMYLAVFVARLVALHINYQMMSRQDPGRKGAGPVTQ